ncbi:MAG: ATP-binding cassette domain-containing protein, partial [Verrucomicrobiota bacterium]
LRLISRRFKTGTATYSILPLLIEVFAGFSKVDGRIDEEEIDSSLGFLRYDYPDAIYSELRELYSQALKESQDLNEIAFELASKLDTEQKVSLGIQLYVLISRSAKELHKEQLISFYLFMTNLGVATEAIDLVYQLNTDEEGENGEKDASKKAEEKKEPNSRPLETLAIARTEPADLVFESLPDDQRLVAFRYQDQILIKNIGERSAFVRGRRLQNGEFLRVYEGQRLVMTNLVLDYQELVFYFNTKKNVSPTRIYLNLTPSGVPFIERSRSKQSHLLITFGLRAVVEVLQDTDASIRRRQLTRPFRGEVSLEDKIIFENGTEIPLRELRRRAREMGGRFELKTSKSEYLVSNNADLLRQGDILLSQVVDGEILLRIRCDYTLKTGELEVLTSNRSVTVHGETVTDRCALRDGDTIVIDKGQFLRCHFAERIIEEERNVINRLEIREVSHSFDDKTTALDGINLTAGRGEMICVLGPSGCGKSTLMRVLSGHQKPGQGDVLLNGFRLYKHIENFVPYIAYIPHEDSFEPLLTIQENIDYAAAIRAPQLPASERRRRVDAKMIELGLNERRHRLAGTQESKHLSSGERKRLNVGLDMVGIGDVYLLDEPTSGLSSKDSEHVLEIIHGLARNKIVFVSIHQPSARLFHLFDKALLLDHGGAMAFYGTPREMLEYFHEAQLETVPPVPDGEEPPLDPKSPPDPVFDVLETPLRDLGGSVIYEEDREGHLVPARRFTPQFWRDRYQAHRTLEEVTGLSGREAPAKGRIPSLPEPPARRWPNEKTHLFTSIKRAFLSKMRNRTNLITTLLEAPLLALLISVVLRYSEEGSYIFADAFHIPTYMFLTLVVGMFLGLTNSADEIIRDNAALTRERNHRVRVPYYLTGKLLALGFFALIQCLIYLSVGNVILEIRGMFWHYLLWMFLTTLTGVVLGMIISCLVRDIKAALNLVPIVLIPQIILGGALIKYEEMNRSLDFFSSVKQRDGVAQAAPSKLEVPLLCEFMPLRWSYEALVVAQGTRNPLVLFQKELDEEVKALSKIPEHTEAQAKRFKALKNALPTILSIEARYPRRVTRTLGRIRKALDRGTFNPEKYAEEMPDPKVSSRDIYENKKVEDLILRAEAEYRDHRRDPTQPLNLFLGQEKHYLGFPASTLKLNFLILLVFIGTGFWILTNLINRRLTRFG